jgi:hypothetical protein
MNLCPSGCYFNSIPCSLILIFLCLLTACIHLSIHSILIFLCHCFLKCLDFFSELIWKCFFLLEALKPFHLLWLLGLFLIFYIRLLLSSYFPSTSPLSQLKKHVSIFHVQVTPVCSPSTSAPHPARWDDSEDISASMPVLSFPCLSPNNPSCIINIWTNVSSHLDLLTAQLLLVSNTSYCSP